ncbi:MAG: UDP-glucose/GDP-mannose dehydrogenase family protein [Candidatus Daviesbacteria bacterium]|nr:UDP-glucose/GDP-mannose dehydrogenase family protein [Candidatus Daviesbacteria bacterium]
MNISVIGTGYVGLVTGAVFADLGHKVCCVDVDESKIEKLIQGEIPFFEPGLQELVKKNLNKGRLIFTTSYEQSVPNSQVVFICVGTPPKNNGEPNLEYLYQATESTAKYLKDYTLIAIKSTVPIGVEKELESVIKKNSDAEFEFASCPEFLREGSAVEDTKTPDRVIIGTNSKKAADILLKLYEHFNGQRIICDLTSAQMTKYAANSLLATKISFANAIANLCESTGADVESVLKGVGLDKRLGRAFLYPGVGYGGSCFPKDISAFIKIAEKEKIDFKLLKAVEEINNNQPKKLFDKVIRELGNIKNETVAILGLAFKPNTDDIREAPSIKIIEMLLNKGAKIKVYDPEAMENVKKLFGDKIQYEETPYLAVTDASAALLITEWNEFKELDLEEIKRLMKKPIIFDGRNIYDPQEVRKLGFIYHSIGRA